MNKTASYGQEGFTCQSCDASWCKIPGLLLGFIKDDEKNFHASLCDRSGSLPVHTTGNYKQFLNTVSVFITWNYIPLLHQQHGYIEIMREPFVLMNFDDKSHVLQPEDDMRMSYSEMEIYDASKDDVFVGELTDVESKQLRILALNGGSIILFLSCSLNLPLIGLRIGAILAVKGIVLFKDDCRAILLCTEASCIKVIQHARIPTPALLFSFPTPNISFMNKIMRLSVDPNKLLSLLSTCRNLVNLLPPNIERLADNVLLQDWLESLVFHADELSPEINKTDLTKREEHFAYPECLNVESQQLPFKYISIKMLHESALSKARERFHSSSLRHDDWQCTAIHCDEIHPSNEAAVIWKNDVIFIAKLVSCTSGCIRLADGCDSIYCLFLSENLEDRQKVTSYTDLEDAAKKFIVLCPEDVGSIVRITEFWVVVERKSDCFSSFITSSGSSSPNESSSSDDIENSYTTYMVVPPDGILVHRKASIPGILGCKGVCSFMGFCHHEEISHPSCTVNKIRKLDDSHCVFLFVVQKGSLQQFRDGVTGFNITALKYDKASKPDECFIQLKGKAASWYSLVHPSMLIRLGVISGTTTTGVTKDPGDFFSFSSSAIEDCIISHIHDFFDETSTFSETELGSFYKAAYIMWKKNHFSHGIEPVFSTDGLITRPPSGPSLLVALQGRIMERVECHNHALSGVEHNYIRLTFLSTMARFKFHVYIRLRDNCSAILLGMIPGAFVTLYRVKLVCTEQGDVYCKYTPTSFHVIQQINFHSQLPSSSSSRTSDIMDDEVPISDAFFTSNISRKNAQNDVVGPIELLYDLYMASWADCEHKMVRIKVYMSKLLCVELKETSDCEDKLRSHSEVPMTSALNVISENNCDISFFAKCIVSDGSGRAIVYFASKNQEDFCKMADISPEEWSDVITLLRRSSAKAVHYDCDLHQGKEPVGNHDPSFDRFAQSICAALFSDVNTRVLAANEIFVRRRFSSAWRPRNCNNAIDTVILDGVRGEAEFKIGTIPVESHGNTSVRSLMLRLMPFNCLAVL